MLEEEKRGIRERSSASLPILIRGLAGKLSKHAQRQKLSIFVQFLLDEGISGEELLRHVEAGRDTPASLEPDLLERVGKEKWLAALGLQYRCEHLDLAAADISPQVARIVPKELATRSRVACVDVDENGMKLAMVNPDDEFAIAEVEARTDFKVHERRVVLDTALTDFHEMLYDTAKYLSVTAREIVDDIIRLAIERHASDIHIEPREDNMDVRFRMDGVLHDAYDLGKVAPKRIMIGYLKSALPVVVKNKSGASGATMDMAEKQKPQDGRIYLPGRKLDMRVSIIPMMQGEGIVIRLHRPEGEEVSLARLGFTGSSLRKLETIIRSPYGILLVSGPTGSGKTTTLYTVLRMLNDRETKILTIEDPVEYSLAGINQVQTNAAKGLTFASALRSFLRHDPDVIMVGEIRDSETARLAVEASLTGHLVLSTIHANDAVRTITRLRDLGVNPLLITSTCLGTLAQRLVRTNCRRCLEPARFTSRFYELLERYSVPYRQKDLLRGAGCPECNHTGYRGRTGIHELLVITPELRELILNHAPDAELEALARRQGMRLLIEDALQKAAQGLTTEAEVLRVTLAEARTQSLADGDRPPLLSTSAGVGGDSRCVDVVPPRDGPRRISQGRKKRRVRRVGVETDGPPRGGDAGSTHPAPVRQEPSSETSVTQPDEETGGTDDAPLVARLHTGVPEESSVAPEANRERPFEATPVGPDESAGARSPAHLETAPVVPDGSLVGDGPEKPAAWIPAGPESRSSVSPGPVVAASDQDFEPAPEGSEQEATAGGLAEGLIFQASDKKASRLGHRYRRKPWTLARDSVGLASLLGMEHWDL